MSVDEMEIIMKLKKNYIVFDARDLTHHEATPEEVSSKVQHCLGSSMSARFTPSYNSFIIIFPLFKSDIRFFLALRERPILL
jgi:hypothetical protein